MEKYLFSLSLADFSFETRRDLTTRKLILISKIPIVRFVVAKYLIWAGYAILRVSKVDPALPDEFRLKGWKIRNRSQRQDGVLWTSGGRVLLTPDKLTTESR
jgi:hypothetical protein